MSLLSESSQLLVDVNVNSSGRFQPRNRPSTHLSSFCLPSKAAILIVLWTFVVGLAFSTIIGVAVILIFTYDQVSPTTSISEYDSLPYALLAIAMIFYPVSGFIADVCCGRLKTVVISLCCLLLSMLLICLLEVMLFTTKLSLYNCSTFFHDEGIFAFIVALISLILFITGLGGYQANIIQFGVDQLCEASSHHLSRFIHYATWAFYNRSLPLVIFIPLLQCTQFKSTIEIMLLSIPFFIVFLLIMLLIISWWKRHWFYTDAGQENPYKTVFEVLNFARKHKYPLQRSAFTYCDDTIPSRIDFSKEKFGGPFSVEQVKNVKTFHRILVVVFALGSVFFLEVPALHFVFPLFSLHFLRYYNHSGEGVCTNERIWELEAGNGFLTALSTISFIHCTCGSHFLFLA